MTVLPQSFYLGDDVAAIARQLLGKYVFTAFDGEITSGRIVETEAYNGRSDKACHAFLKKTRRTEIMYQTGGLAYIYLCYGIHHMFNVVTNVEGKADAVLIRAVEPAQGLDTMIRRRGGDRKYKLTAGPGALGQALGIHTSYSGTSLWKPENIWICRSGTQECFTIEADRRVGVDFAGEDAYLPWRFFIAGSPWLSKRKHTAG